MLAEEPRYRYQTMQQAVDERGELIGPGKENSVVNTIQLATDHADPRARLELAVQKKGRRRIMYNTANFENYTFKNKLYKIKDIECEELVKRFEKMIDSK